MRKTCLNMVYELAQQDERIFFVGSDLGYKTLDDFCQSIPNRFIMEGVSEANVVGLAAGLALEGKIPYVNTIATFLTRRAFDQIVVDLCLHNLPVRLIGNGGGLVYAPLGSTHLAFEDIGILSTLPNMTIIAPADELEMRKLMPQTVDYPGPIYIRLAKGYDPIVTDENTPFCIGKGICIHKGHDALIVTTGVTLKIAKQACEILEQQDIDAGILHLPTVKPLDVELFLDLAQQVKTVVTIEEHTLSGGLGNSIAAVLAEANFNQPKRFKRLGIPDVFPDRYGSQTDLMTFYGLTADNLADTVNKLMQT